MPEPWELFGLCMGALAAMTGFDLAIAWLTRTADEASSDT